MALSRTSRLSANSGSNHGTGSYTTGAFTPSDNSLLVVCVVSMTQDTSGDTSSEITCSGGGWTYTPEVNFGKSLSPTTFALNARIFTAPVTTGASMTLTIDHGTRNVLRYLVSVFDYTGYNTSDPVGLTATNDPAATSGAVSFNLSSGPTEGSEIVGLLASDTGSASTPGTGWTEIHDNQALGDAGIETQARLAEGSFVVASAAAALSTNDPAVTFTGYVPLENDIVVLFPSSTTVLDVVADASLPSGWSNPLGDGIEVNSDAHGICCLTHVVTAAEETAGTTTYTATNALAAAETGNVTGCVLRGVSGIDAINTTFDSGNSATPHVLASLPGASLSDGSQVVSCVAKDATGAYSTDPTGWTGLVTSNTNQGKWLGRRNTYTTAGVDVAATNITPSAGDEYASVTAAFLATGSPTNDPAVSWVDIATAGSNDVFLMAVEVKEAAGGATVNGTAVGAFTFTATANGVPETFGNAAVSLTFAATASGVDRALGVAAAALTFTGAASGQAGTPPVTGTAQAAFTFTGAASGIPEAFGQAAANLSFTGTAAGVDRALGVALASLAFGSTALGVDRALGQAAATLTFAASATGVPDVHGTAGAALTFTATANGFAGAPPVTGQATASLTFTATAAGIDRTLGAAAGSLTFSGTAAGIDRALGTATAPFTVTATVIGQRKTFAQAAAVLAFTGSASAFVGVIPVPAGHQVVVDREYAVVIRSTHAVVVTGTSHTVEVT